MKNDSERIKGPIVSMMVTAPASNSGKTAVTCGLLAAMKRRGMDTCAFKCGPDYIDPMFHRSVLGIESRNLDAFLAGEDGVRRVFGSGSCGRDAVICEGVMGYYDGIMTVDKSHEGERTRASAWHLSTLLDIPTLLVVRPAGSAISLAAVIKGMAQFRSPSNIAAVILNDCSPAYYRTYAEILEEECGVPILGYLPHMEEAEIHSRHLGLMTAGEIGDLRERIDRIAQTMEETLDMDRLTNIFSRDRQSDEAAELESDHEEKDGSVGDGKVPYVAIARDEAFCFIYEETIEALEKAGASPVFFSPLKDKKLPEGIGGIYLPGGYPELYGEELAANESIRKEIRKAIDGGLPTIAECGGFLYLGSSIEDGEGGIWPMVGSLPGDSKNAGHLVRFGYGHIVSERDSMLFKKGEKVPVHEFHYWDTTENGSDLELIKARDGKRWRFGFCNDHIYAGFPHLYFAGEVDLADRFVAAVRNFLKSGRHMICEDGEGTV